MRRPQAHTRHFPRSSSMQSRQFFLFWLQRLKSCSFSFTHALLLTSRLAWSRPSSTRLCRLLSLLRAFSLAFLVACSSYGALGGTTGWHAPSPLALSSMASVMLSGSAGPVRVALRGGLDSASAPHMRVGLPSQSSIRRNLTAPTQRLPPPLRLHRPSA